MTLWPIPALGSMNRLIPNLAYAISKAEGYGILNAIPTRANNPGDLVLGDMGLGTLGSAGITVYPIFKLGCLALYHELNLILSNTSHVYNTRMTFSQMAVLWTGNDNASIWATIVAKSLSISPSTTILSWMTNHI